MSDCFAGERGSVRRRDQGATVKSALKINQKTNHMHVVHRIYNVVETVLYAFAIGMGLMIIATIRRIPEMRAKFEQNRAQEISEENKVYCEKWGKREGTHEYTLCTIDLFEIREKQPKRVSDDMRL
jgi:hypothetical protein